MLKRMFRWATDRKHAPEAYQPGALKATFQRYLGLGWYGIEEDASGVRVWSQDVAEIKITPDVTRVFLSFTSHFHEWTGSPQLVEFAKDGRHDFTLHVTAERTDVMVQCKRNSIISIRAATAKPSQFQHTRDSRAVGICLDDLSVKAGRPSVRVDEPKYAWSQEESNSTFVPHTLQLEITSACNLKCTMCVNHAPSNPKLWSLAGHMDGSLWDKVRPVLPDAEVLFLLGDGEVFTHPKFLSYVEEADGLGVKTVFSTNGHFLGPEVIERLAALRHLFRMTLSIDSPDAEVYQRIRGGQLAPVMQGLKELGRRPALADQICVNAVVMKSTLPSLQQFPRLLAEMGLKNLTLRGLFNYDFQMSEECPDYNDNDLRMLRNIKSDCEAYGIHLSLLPPLPVELVQVSADTLHADLRRESPLTQVELPGPMSKQCFDPWERAVITRDGCVYPCEVFGLASGALGNLKSQSFEQVWRGEPFRNFRSDLLHGRQLGCANCVRRQTGAHPLVHYAARIIDDQCWSSGDDEVVLRVENTGAFTWTRETKLHLATSGRRDRTDSIYYHPRWLSPNRVCTFVEDKVAPAEKATFRFRVSNVKAKAPERFQLVFDGRFWLPNTQFQFPFATRG